AGDGFPRHSDRFSFSCVGFDKNKIHFADSACEFECRSLFSLLLLRCCNVHRLVTGELRKILPSEEGSLIFGSSEMMASLV
uniref:Uncharacterized protein n=1 Tax=Aegilops tauschii subsp. strangulata TaxID=200361 RepID=A0A453BAT0_AEGTS